MVIFGLIIFFCAGCRAEESCCEDCGSISSIKVVDSSTIFVVPFVEVGAFSGMEKPLPLPTKSGNRSELQAVQEN